MNNFRKTAIVVGILYIIGTVTGFLYKMVFTGSIHNDLNLLTQVAANEKQVIIGAIFLLIMGLALAMVPAMMFPVLKKHNEALAMGYVVYRGALETITTMAAVISWVFLTVLSQQYTAGAPDASYLQTFSSLLLKGNDTLGTISQVVFPLGALMFYWILYKTKLIPRWISGWGIIAAGWVLVMTSLDLFGISGSWSTTLVDLLDFPIFSQEMVMAVWLIVKGFNHSAIASLSAKTAANGLLSKS
jgi:hypothetical protein